jgi:colanic acid/amylovoran biosynthesis glycosyltransferase
MPIIAYLANQFPSPVEPYVADEIKELRRRKAVVIPCSAWRAASDLDDNLKPLADETLYLQPVRLGLLVRAAWLCVKEFSQLADLVARVAQRGNEPPSRRARALLHTWLGAYYALLLKERGVEHIHVHHGYFASWIAMVAARLLRIGFSMTLHGSDLLLHAAYLDTKLENCRFCLTVSEFNRQYALEHYPDIEPEKIMVCRMGITPAKQVAKLDEVRRPDVQIVMLAVGRLHPVKGHAFLLQACRELKDRGSRFLCLIAGEGPERPALERLIHNLRLQENVQLLGHLSRQRLDAYYAACDLVVLTSRSEGIPLVLMEAMAHSRPVLAPAITGIPELVLHGETGFLYRAGSLDDFVKQVEAIHDARPLLGPLRRAARRHVLEHFNRENNLVAFCDLFLARVNETAELGTHEDSLLQQVQLCL